jgi:heptosyltransferase II
MSLRPIKELNPKKILIRATNWIGDAVMTTPAVHSIRKNFPDAEITMLAVPWVADIFSLSPDIDRIFSYDKRNIYQGKVKGPIKLAIDIKKEKFDATILLQNAFEAAVIAKMAGIPVRAGYKRDGRGPLLSHGVDISDETRKKHQVHYYQDMLRDLGLTPGPDHLRITLPEDLMLWARELVGGFKYQSPFSNYELQQGKDLPDPAELKSVKDSDTHVPVIGFNPGAAFGPAKQWPAEKFAQLASIISHNYGESGCVIMVFGTNVDTKNAQTIKNFSIRTPYHVQDMTGKTDLKEAMALIKCCDAFVTNDSGLMHVGAGLDVPSIAIFGSTDHIATGPYSKNAKIVRREMQCSPCMKTHCPEDHLNCLESISATDVYEEVVKMLSTNSKVNP